MHTDTSVVSLLGDRENNQDAAKVGTHRGATLLVVADGMGGHADGAGAAQAAVAAVDKAFRARGDDVQAFLAGAMQAAHQAVLALGRDMSIEERPRTTCVAALVADGCAWWAHVGDSRAYLLRKGRTRQRTRDHSHVEALFAAGEISEAEAHSHPMKNLVDRSIGGEPEPVEVDLAGPFELAAGDIVLLCSDGFWDRLNFDAAAELLGGAEPLDAALEELADAARKAASPYADNTTAVALRVGS